MADITIRKENPVDKLKRTLSADSVQQQFKNALEKGASLFVASLIDLYNGDKYLQECDPSAVIIEALKAATLRLPLNKTLGFAYIIPFKNNKEQTVDPVMVIGYKGYLQLAQRTGQYRYINADCIYEGESVDRDRLTGEVIISGKPTSDKAIAYFAFFETITGFRKVICWTRKEVDDHAKKYSKSYHNPKGKWKSDFNVMAIKTVIRQLISKYGIMSIDIANAIDVDSADDRELEIETPQRKAISYETTAKPPALEEKSKVVDFKKSPEQYPQYKPQDEPPTAQEPPPESSEQTEPPPEKDNQQDQTGQTDDSNGNGEGSSEDWEDEFGTPSDHPLTKKAWFSMRAGSFKSGTGFKFYVHSNREYIKDISDKAFACLFDKFQKLYGESMPWGRHGEILNGADSEMAEEEKPQSKADILNSPMAIKLAEMANKHPDHYKLIVQGRIPESIEQMVTWVEQINTMVVNARLNSNL